MTLPTRRTQESAIGFLLCLFMSQALMSQSLATELRLTASLVFRAPTVRSYAVAVLYDRDGRRLYEQVILGHQVYDDTFQYLMYNARVESEQGYANSASRDMPGHHGNCYSAAFGAHANSYNLHKVGIRSLECMPDPPPPPASEVPKENCPVLLDLARDGFHLSSAEPPVRFDIDADGVTDSIAWTKAGEDEAFLCLDRNHNGIIDDGRELFGYATLLPSGEQAKVGYRALGELDRPDLGGNRDGRIDNSDRMFRDLCAWLDQDRDGISQPYEIYTLDQVGVVALEYHYRTTHLADQYGNLFRYTAQVQMRTPAGTVRQWPTFDVIFTEP